MSDSIKISRVIQQRFLTRKMHGYKDLSKRTGSDGYHMGFFQKCWTRVKEDLMKKAARELKNFRPIDLIGSFYKIMMFLGAVSGLHVNWLRIVCYQLIKCWICKLWLQFWAAKQRFFHLFEITI
ncbi:hypothetical protein H5410_041019 [Solanum commersonii]|uniref:Uncharacterized protein n=1 Tax=Solanum commersonii TaxID=4109 RepID=A0A9J5XQM0_SOLCO|nr:hypothetical protein H5410_041019 [Solanum commersonii]